MLPRSTLHVRRSNLVKKPSWSTQNSIIRWNNRISNAHQRGKETLWTSENQYTEQKKLAAAVSRAASNINQICRRINSTGHCYEDDVAELKARQAEIWELLKVRQRDELWPQRDFPCVGFPSPVFRTVDKLTLRSVPQPDFWSMDFQTVTGDEIHTQINKK